MTHLACVLVFHTCRPFVAQRHQTTRPEPIVTSAGRSEPFFVGCHSAAISGNINASEFVEDGRLPAQNGQPVGEGCTVRSEIDACHS